MDDLKTLSVEELWGRYSHASAHLHPSRSMPRAEAEAMFDEKDRVFAAIEAELRSRPIDDWQTSIRGFRKMTPDVRAEAVQIQLDNMFGTPEGVEPTWKRARRIGLVKSPLAKHSIPELKKQFAALAIRRDDAIGDPPLVDKLYWKIDAVLTELEYREGDQRTVLADFFTHHNVAVRAAAAERLRHVIPELALSRMLAVDDPEWTPAFAERGLYLGPVEEDGAPGKPYPRLWLGNAESRSLADDYGPRGAALQRAEDDFDTPRCNRLIEQIWAIDRELEKRGDLRVLLPLLEYSNTTVQLYAARACREAFPAEARAAFVSVAGSFRTPHAFEARSELERLDGDDWFDRRWAQRRARVPAG